MVKPTLRTKSIGFKVKEEDSTTLDAAAETSGRSLGSGAREVLLASVNGQDPQAAADSAGTGKVALLGELMALRVIVLNVLCKQGNGETLTASEMKGLIDRADSRKLKNARERLAQAAEPDMHPKESKIVFRGSGSVKMWRQDR